MTFREYLAHHRIARTAASIEARHLARVVREFDSVFEAERVLAEAGAAQDTVAALRDMWRGWRDTRAHAQKKARSD